MAGRSGGGTQHLAELRIGARVAVEELAERGLGIKAVRVDEPYALRRHRGLVGHRVFVTEEVKGGKLSLRGGLCLGCGTYGRLKDVRQ